MNTMNMAGEENGGEQTTECDDWEKRLEQNIAWIRDEIAELKKQDKSLTRQFIELRSVIHHLKRYGVFHRIPSYTQDMNSNELENKNGSSTTPRSPQPSPKKVTTNWYQTLPSKKSMNHPRGPGEPKPNPPQHFFNEDSEESDEGSMEEIPAFHELNEYRGRAVSVLTPTCVSSPEPYELYLARTRNMSFTSGATEDEFDC